MQTVCSMCKNDLGGFLNITLECGHIYHKKCIQYNSRCTVCQFETKLVPLFETQKELDDYYFNKYDITICDAAQRNDMNIVSDMITHGVSICKCAIDKSSYLGHFNIVKYLVEHNGIIDENALTAASLGNHPQIVKYLLEHNAPKSSRPLCVALNKGYTEIVVILLKNGIRLDKDVISQSEFEFLKRVKNSIRKKKKKFSGRNEIEDEEILLTI
jgi:ankyrin repeat protein